MTDVKPQDVQCSVTVAIFDGKLSIVASIPDGAEESVPGMLAKMMIEHATNVLNGTLGENKFIRSHGTN